jgi:hypothetical protein
MFKFQTWESLQRAKKPQACLMLTINILFPKNGDFCMACRGYLKGEFPNSEKSGKILKISGFWYGNGQSTQHSRWVIRLTRRTATISYLQGNLQDTIFHNILVGTGEDDE